MSIYKRVYRLKAESIVSEIINACLDNANTLIKSIYCYKYNSKTFRYEKFKIVGHVKLSR